jgi:acetyl esterase/lipase
MTVANAAAQPMQQPVVPPLPGPLPTVKDVAYAPSDTTTGKGHLLDLYLPKAGSGPVPLVIFTRGSAWMADNGRDDAQGLAGVLNSHGYAVAGVAIRSTAQGRFPDQLHDIKAAIRWLRANAATYNLDRDHIGIVGESSGGWTSLMAAVTGDVPMLEGQLGNAGVSSAVQAAVAFYPPTNFLEMDRWALGPCDPQGTAFQAQFCHSPADSPESRLVGCPIQTCPEAVQRANPTNYISRGDPPIMILHGERDALVPHAQGEAFYQALNKACHEAAFVSFPLAIHGQWYQMLTDPKLAYGATIRSTAAQGCKISNAQPVVPSWGIVIDFLDRHLKPAAVH